MSVGSAVDDVADIGRFSGFNVQSPVPIVNQALRSQAIQPVRQFPASMG